MHSDENVQIVGIADLKVAAAPAILRTNLGSCVAVCVYAAERRVGALLHVMMPAAGQAAAKASLKKTKYADTGIAEMMYKLKTAHGLEPPALTAKIFGGAKVLPDVTQNIGNENEVAVRRNLAQYGIKIIAYKTGGERGYKINFDVSTGKVVCEIFGGQPEEY
ncbi:MAG: chemotaxis protein CheD [Candidatus Omnitrophica bacterium]|nr:chemotaxis protein CheD [Candidatus Omnitrophota bacterium]